MQFVESNPQVNYYVYMSKDWKLDFSADLAINKTKMEERLKSVVQQFQFNSSDCF